jgi:hypothetical protein
MATLKSWRLLRKLRCSTTRITALVQAVLTLHLDASGRGWQGLRAVLLPKDPHGLMPRVFFGRAEGGTVPGLRPADPALLPVVPARWGCRAGQVHDGKLRTGLAELGGGGRRRGRIANECPLPCAPGQLDLSAQAFAELAAPWLGRIPVTWSLLSPSTSGTVSIRYKTGSSRWWCAIQVIGHRNPVARLEVRTGGGWHQLPRADYNYFLSDQGSGCGGAIRITDIYGEPLVLNGIALWPDAVQPTRVQFAQH